MKVINKLAPKPHKTFQQQLELLKSRGLVVADDRKAIGYLRTLGYYRLSGYTHVFRIRQANGNLTDSFYQDISFQSVKDLYMFDKKLRQLALDALERIEIAMRVKISYRLGDFDTLAHLDAQYFSDTTKHTEWVRRYQSIVQRESKTDFVKHHQQKYDDIPIWVGCELWDFGTMSKLYKIMRQADKDAIATSLNLRSAKLLENQLHAFNYIRNLSAHHARLWNRNMVFKASQKGLESDYKLFSNKKMMLYFCLMQRMLNSICPNSQWAQRFLALLDEFPQINNATVSLK